MANLNEVKLIGRLTRDPELQTTNNGSSVCKLGFATSRKYKDSQGIQKEETCFVDITCWGSLAENVSKFLFKGSLAYVGGRLKFEQWQDKDTGQNRSKLVVIAENIQFLTSKQQQGQPVGISAGNYEAGNSYGGPGAGGGMPGGGMPGGGVPNQWPPNAPSDEPPF